MTNFDNWSSLENNKFLIAYIKINFTVVVKYKLEQLKNINKLSKYMQLFLTLKIWKKTLLSIEKSKTYLCMKNIKVKRQTTNQKKYV